MKRTSRDSLDHWLDGKYRRHGWRRLLGGYIALCWLGGLLGGMVGGAFFARIDEWSSRQVIEVLGALLAIWLIGASAGVAGSLRLAERLRSLDDQDDTSGLLDAWRTTLKWPVAVSRWNCLVAATWCLPACLGAVTWLGSAIDLPLVLMFVVFETSAVVVAGFAGLFGAQVVVRPVLRDLAKRLDDPPSPSGGPSVRSKLLIIVPAFAIAMSVVGAFATAGPGADRDDLLISLLIAAVATTVLAIPITLLLAHSLVLPLDDLLSATERIKLSDFATPAPELSTDEYGAVARSLNEAMRGLAERQRLSEDNERLLAEVQRLLGEARASRTRIVAASDAERRRVERNIHDGAQQQLVALSLDIRLLEERAAAASAEDLRQMAADALEGLTSALAELRELARGLHPSVLATDGLAPALAQLAARSAIPVGVSVPTERFPDTVESTAYFVASEGLANIAKHAQASRAEISVDCRNGDFRLSVSDDGIGGANPNSGSGLEGLADRVAALDGHIDFESPLGVGTTLSITLPLPSDARAD